MCVSGRSLRGPSLVYLVHFELNFFVWQSSDGPDYVQCLRLFFYLDKQISLAYMFRTVSTVDQLKCFKKRNQLKVFFPLVVFCSPCPLLGSESEQHRVSGLVSGTAETRPPQRGGDPERQQVSSVSLHSWKTRPVSECQDIGSR